MFCVRFSLRYLNVTVFIIQDLFDLSKIYELAAICMSIVSLKKQLQ